MNSKIQINSVFRRIVNDLDFEKGKLPTLKKKCISFIVKTKVKDVDKRKMIFNIQQQDSNISLCRYVFNSMLKFEKMGVD